MRCSLFVAFAVVFGALAHVSAQVEPMPTLPQPPQPSQAVEALPPVPPSQPVAQPYAPSPYAPAQYAPTPLPPSAPSQPIDAAPFQAAVYPSQPVPSPDAYQQAPPSPAVCTPLVAASTPYAPAPSVTAAPQPPSEKEQLAKKAVELHNLQMEVDRLRQSTGTPSQVLVKLQMIEVSRTKMRAIGFDFTAISGKDMQLSNISEILSKSAASKSPITTKGTQPTAFGSIDDSSAFSGFLEALRREQIAKVLAEPTIVTCFGQASSFSSGGEFPLVSGLSKGSSSVQYMKFGTEVEIVPMSLGDNRLRIQLRFRVSEIDEARSVTIEGVRIPGLRVCEVRTGFDMALGQTMILHGGNLTRRVVEKRAEPDTNQQRVRETVEELETLVLVTPQAMDKSPNAQTSAAPTSDTNAPTESAQAATTTSQPTAPRLAPELPPITSSARRVRQPMPRPPVASVARRLPAPRPAPQNKAATGPAVSVHLQVIDVDLNKLRSAGFDVKSTDDPSFVPFDSRLSIKGGPKFVSRAFGDFFAMLVEKKVAQIVARPQLMTLSGQQAQIHLGNEVDAVIAGQPDKIAKAFVGTEFSVLPSVDSRGQITLDYTCRSSELNRATTFTIDDKPFHTVTRCEAVSAVKLDDGQTVIVGESARRTPTDLDDQTPSTSNRGKEAVVGSKSDEVRRIIVLTAHVVKPTSSEEPAISAVETGATPSTEVPHEARGYASPAEAQPK